MRTPPPVLPPAGSGDAAYKPTRLDREGPDAAIRMRAAVFGMIVGLVAWMVLAISAARGGSAATGTIIAALIPCAALGYVVKRAALWVADRAGDAFLFVVAPRGDHTPYEEQFSYEDSLAIRGDVAGALAAYERHIAERPTAVSPRRRAAELYVGKGDNPRRAAELFREIRAIDGVSTSDSIYATSRLVDLYDGVLDEPGRALVELRRIVELHPGSPLAAHARDALPRLKARLNAESAGNG